MINFEEFSHFFNKIIITEIYDNYYYSSCQLKHVKNSFSIRKIEIKNYCHCFISLSQSDKTYFRKENYIYCKLRLIVVKIENENENYFEYIDSISNNLKDISIECCLKPGNYFIFVCCDWNKNV